MFGNLLASVADRRFEKPGIDLHDKIVKRRQKFITKAATGTDLSRNRRI